MPFGCIRTLLRLALAGSVVLALPGCGSLIVTSRSVADLEGRRGFTWETHEADGFVVYAEVDSTAAGAFAGIVSDAVTARDRVASYLREPTYASTVSIFVVADRVRMKDLIGRETNATGYHQSNVLCVVEGRGLPARITHELLHVAAMNQWGVPERWINEGAAMDADVHARGGDLHVAARRLRDQGRLPALRDLAYRFSRFTSDVSYPAAGSFVRFLRETYGFDALRRVWDGGRASFRDATGVELGALEAEWLAVVDAAEFAAGP